MFIELNEEDVKFLAGGQTIDFRENDRIRAACESALSTDQKWWREKIAFAEGKLQFQEFGGTWHDCKNNAPPPIWGAFSVRIKPEPKPDVISYLGISDHWGWCEADNKNELRRDSIIKIIRDGETNILKSAEIIK